MKIHDYIELRKHGDYKLADFWIRIFLFVGKIFSKSWHGNIVDNFHTVSVITETLYSPADKEPSDRLIKHELKHIDQKNRDGLLMFSSKYIFSRQARLEYEVEAYRHDGREFEQIVDSLSSGAYLFYGWDKQTIRKKIVDVY
jgi:hypothetical protein